MLLRAEVCVQLILGCWRRSCPKLNPCISYIAHSHRCNVRKKSYTTLNHQNITKCLKELEHNLFPLLRSLATAPPSPPTTWWRAPWASSASSAWRTSSMRWCFLLKTYSLPHIWWKTFDATFAEQYQMLNLFWQQYSHELPILYYLFWHCTSKILSVVPNFKYASNFLWPFKLNTPVGGWRKKVNHFVEGEYLFSICLDFSLSYSLMMLHIWHLLSKQMMRLTP